MTAIIDYGVGNLFSLKSSLKAIGEEPVITGDKNILEYADRLILPGVGAFRDAIAALKESGMGTAVTELASQGKPVLGICLGMQLMFEKDYEDGVYEGLGLIPGSIMAISESIPPALKIPHTGWNSLILRKPSRLFKYISEGECVYFVHSYHATGCENQTIAVAEYGSMLTACVEYGNLFGTQFHPEKSGDTGLRILKAFMEMKQC
ncbi:MAG: imidazole glycerol phosphate synthase subunit HisH [Sphaerochaeta sp.]